MEDKTINKPDWQTLKHCTKCGEDKLLDDFTTAKASKDGKSWMCKKCTAKFQRERYAKKHGVNTEPAKDNRLKEIAKKVENRQKPNSGSDLIAILKSKQAELRAEIDRIDSAITVIQGIM